LDKKSSEVLVNGNCSQLDSSSTLITIHNKGEQEFLSNLLSKYNNISDNVWIGLEFSNKSFKWIDNEVLGFQNWDKNAVKDGSLPCVTLNAQNSGKWEDDSCRKKYSIVCQKKQSSKQF
jgi:hypothetical protein